MSASRPGPARPALWVTIASLGFLLVAVVAVGLALSGGWAGWSDLRESATAAWRVRPVLLVAAVVFAAMGWLVSGLTWGWLFRSAGGRLSLREAANAWIGSNLGRYVPGKIWQVTGLAAYVRARGGSSAVTLATLLSFQAVFLAIGGAVSLATLGPAAFAGAEPWAIMAAVLAIALAMIPAVLNRAVRLAQRLLRESGTHEEFVLEPVALLRTGCGVLLAWFLHGFGFWALLEGLVSAHSIGPLTAMGVFSTSYVVGYLALVAPGGMVVREGAMTSLLGLTSAIPLGPAAALSMAARLWATVGELAAFGAGMAVQLVAANIRRSRVEG